jgi:hypothetical protein
LARLKISINQRRPLEAALDQTEKKLGVSPSAMKIHGFQLHLSSSAKNRITPTVDEGARQAVGEPA